MAIGGFLGAIAAYYGKAVDNIIMRITDVVMADGEDVSVRYAVHVRRNTAARLRRDF